MKPTYYPPDVYQPMTVYENLDEWIRSENGHQDSVEDQVIAANWFLRNTITVTEDRVARTSQVRERIGDRLEHRTRTALDNLEDIGVLVQFDPPGSGSYIRHHRTGQNFFNPRAREWVPLLEEDIDRFINDIQTQEKSEISPVADGGQDTDEDDDEDITPTLRSVAADALGVDPVDVENVLTAVPDEVEQMNCYDTAVKAIKSNEDVSRNQDYDEMGWRNSALRWSLSERATHIAMNQSITA